jgi:multidrug efflux system outer membrane protein
MSRAYWNMQTAATLTAAAALLAGCTLAPHYDRPKPPVPAAWNAGARTSAVEAGDDCRAAATHDGTPHRDGCEIDAGDLGWRDFFPDERMQRLVELALANNRDLRVAALNVDAAEAQYRIQRAGLFPTINATGLEQVEKTPGGVAASSGGTGTGGAGVGTGGAGVGTGSVITRYYNAGVGFTAYELDLFGRVRSLDRAAFEQYMGFEQSRRSARLSLIAEVANAYLVIAADRAILKVTQDTFQAQSASNELIRHSLNAGTATALTMRQSDITVATASANLAAYSRQLEQDRNALLLLIGTDIPADFQFADDLEPTRQSPELPAGLPSEVLARRPDVLSAEHQLEAANADIGAARAAFFPSISLTGNSGFASTQLSGLFKHSSETWTFSPQISIPIFTGGANSANLDLAKIQKNVFIAQYEKAIQSAFREVDDALAARSTIDRQMTAQRALLDASADTYRLADMRFKAGVDSFLTVLDAQRSLYSAQQGLVLLQLQRLQNMATLYKALGGGLREHSEHL